MGLQQPALPWNHPSNVGGQRCPLPSQLPDRGGCIVKRLMSKWFRHAPHSPAKLHARIGLEALESRIVPYSLSGNAWPVPKLITLSFVPDGTDVGGTSDMFARFNSHPGWTTSTW